MKLVEWLLVAVVAIILLFLVFIAVDWAGGTNQTENGLVIGHRYKPAYTTIDCQYDSKGNLTGCYDQYHPEQFTIDVRSSSGIIDSKNVSKDEWYNLTDLESEVVYTVRIGWLSGNRY